MRFRLLVIALSGVVVASSACSDATAPQPLAAPEQAGLTQGLGDGGLGNKPADASEDTAYTFTIDPQRFQQLNFGQHTLYVPAHAICQAGSGYGLTFWDKPCTPETAPITVTVKVKGATKGFPRVDFQPELRFNPRTTVVLALTVKGKGWANADSWRILYCATSSQNGCIDESLLDSSLATQLDRQTHQVFRRIKHFSGYLVAE
jgi:hypothetical protein